MRVGGDHVNRVAMFSRLVRPGVGDLIQTNILLRLLRDTYPEASVTWVLGAYVADYPFEADMVRGHSFADEIVLCPDAEDADPQRWGTFLDALPGRRFDVGVIDPRGVGLGVAEAADARIPIRVALVRGHADDDLITHPMRLEPTGPDGPDLYDYAAALARAVGTDLDPNPDLLVPRLPYRPEPVPAWATRRPFFGLHPGCSAGWSRRWPLVRYIELAVRLVDELDATVLVLGGDDESVEVGLLQEAVLAHRADARVHTRLGQSVNTVANLIDRMDLLVGNDSGLAHLAAALSTPTVVVYGPADGEALWKRSYPQHLGVNRHPPCQIRHNGPIVWNGQCALECPCDYVAPEGPYPQCLVDITVDEVWQAVRTQLARPRSVGA